MKKILFLLFLTFSAPFLSHAHAGVVLIGHYTNQTISGGDDPHLLSGFNLSLYREENVVFADILMANGSSEPVRGTVSELKYDPAHHAISFKAKFSAGVEVSKETGPEGRQSRELIIFDGKVFPHSVRGKLVQKDGYSGKMTSKPANVTMKRYEFDYVPNSYEQWKASHQEPAPW